MNGLGLHSSGLQVCVSTSHGISISIRIVITALSSNGQHGCRVRQNELSSTVSIGLYMTFNSKLSGLYKTIL